MIFRYPGGKSKLVPAILDALPPGAEWEFHDVFAGGGSVSLAVAKEYPYCQIKMNDLDENIASFWKMFEGGGSFNLFYELLDQTPTVMLFEEMRRTPPTTLEERAYYAIFFNRTTFSGISTASPIGGPKQLSKWKIGCRYNAGRLRKEIEKARALLNGRVKVYNKHFRDYLNAVQNNPPMYLDPPYYTQGKSLYPVYMEHREHIELSTLLEGAENWVLSYDVCPQIEQLYSWADKRRVDMFYSIRGQKKNWTQRAEYLITP